MYRILPEVEQESSNEDETQKSPGTSWRKNDERQKVSR